MTSCFNVVSIVFHTSVPALQKCTHTSRKKILLSESAATCAPPAALLRRTWKTRLPSPLWVVQRHESHWSRGLASTADVENTQRTVLDCCNSWTGSMEPSIVTLEQNTCTQTSTSFGLDCRTRGDSLGDLHTLYWSQRFPWACSAPKLPLAYPKRESA